jgi:DNA-binding response OmpR family regulator
MPVKMVVDILSSPQSILLVDDDAEVRETVSILLEREGFLAIQAADGKSGLQQALSLKPALMLVDLRLPRLSGIELCKEIREQRLTTPIIILSAVRDEVDKVLLLEIGADDYVVKPFGTRELLARIRAEAPGKPPASCVSAMCKWTWTAESSCEPAMKSGLLPLNTIYSPSFCKTWIVC